jgi:hypothetical protein
MGWARMMYVATPVMVRRPVGVRTRLTELADRLAVSCPSSIR